MKVLLIFICCLSISTCFGQHGYKTYFKAETGLFPINLNKIENGNYLGRVHFYDSLRNETFGFIEINTNFDSIQSFKIKYLNGSLRCTNYEDTIYSFREVFNDSTRMVQFEFSKYTKNGVVLVNKIMDILAYEHVGGWVNQNGVQAFSPPNMYGLTILPSRQIIVYGEGMDKRLPNTGNANFKTFLMRYDMQGQPLSDMIWYEYSPYLKRRITSVIKDIDDRFLFLQQQSSPISENSKTFNHINKLNDDNTISTLASVEIELFDERGRMTIDSLGNFYITSPNRDGIEDINFSGDVPTFSKIDRLTGQEIFRATIPPSFGKYSGSNIDNPASYPRIDGLKILSNNDILVWGSVSLEDTFNFPKLGIKKEKNVSTSWFGRLDSNGKKLWAHYCIINHESGPLSLTLAPPIEEDNGDILLQASIAKEAKDLWIYEDRMPLVARVNSKGCFDDNCSHVDKYWDLPSLKSKVNDENLIRALTVFPNPVSDKLSIVIPDEVTYPLNYEIVDLSGRKMEFSEVLSQTDMVDINTQHYGSGIYITILVDDKGQAWQSKWVKE